MTFYGKVFSGFRNRNPQAVYSDFSFGNLKPLTFWFPKPKPGKIFHFAKPETILSLVMFRFSSCINPNMLTPCELLQFFFTRNPKPKMVSGFSKCKSCQVSDGN